MTVLCAWSAQAQNKNYITRVFDFMPAPGQFVNNSPEYHVGEPRDSVMARVLQRLGPEIKVIPIYDDDDNQIGERTVEKPVTGRLISLGAFGGYVIFGFDHPLVNVPGEFDLQIFGNGFGSDSLAVAGGSSEPGIVVAGVDMDGDGEYEIAASIILIVFELLDLEYAADMLLLIARCAKEDGMKDFMDALFKKDGPFEVENIS